jgi:hypothetical protein
VVVPEAPGGELFLGRAPLPAAVSFAIVVVVVGIVLLVGDSVRWEGRSNKEASSNASSPEGIGRVGDTVIVGVADVERPSDRGGCPSKARRRRSEVVGAHRAHGFILGQCRKPSGVAIASARMNVLAIVRVVDRPI